MPYHDVLINVAHWAQEIKKACIALDASPLSSQI